jgi:hypothetical protein
MAEILDKLIWPQKGLVRIAFLEQIWRPWSCKAAREILAEVFRVRSQSWMG